MGKIPRLYDRYDCFEIDKWINKDIPNPRKFLEIIGEKMVGFLYEYYLQGNKMIFLSVTMLIVLQKKTTFLIGCCQGDKDIPCFSKLKRRTLRLRM